MTETAQHCRCIRVCCDNTTFPIQASPMFGRSEPRSGASKMNQHPSLGNGDQSTQLFLLYGREDHSPHSTLRTLVFVFVLSHFSARYALWLELVRRLVRCIHFATPTGTLSRSTYKWAGAYAPYVADRALIFCRNTHRGGRGC